MSERVRARIIVLLATAIALAGCARAGSSPPANRVEPRGHDYAGSDPLSERDAFELAQPVFEEYCADCHTTATGSAAALEHFSMDAYPFGGHHSEDIGDAIRASLGAAGGQATMPKGRPGIVKGEQLQRVLEWADAFERTRAEQSAPHEHGHGATEHEHHDH